MTDTEILEKWLATFGQGVDKKSLEERVISYGNHLWHLFSWDLVPCRKEDEAREAFDELQYTEAIKFYDGYSNGIKNVSATHKITAKAIEEDPNSDVYIVAKDFSWTYVRTHESMCGPYLCVKKIPDDVFAY